MTPSDFKAWRKRLGLTQQEAADRLGLSRGSVENYERGRRREDSRPVEVPLTVELACQAATLDEAVAQGDARLLTDEMRERVLALAEIIRR